MSSRNQERLSAYHSSNSLASSKEKWFKKVDQSVVVKEEIGKGLSNSFGSLLSLSHTSFPLIWVKGSFSLLFCVSSSLSLCYCFLVTDNEPAVEKKVDNKIMFKRR